MHKPPGLIKCVEEEEKNWDDSEEEEHIGAGGGECGEEKQDYFEKGEQCPQRREKQ